MRKYFIEAALIIFSVLFALFINKLFDSYKTNKQKEIALESITREIEKNSAILYSWNEHHLKIHNRISNIIEKSDDSLRIELLKNKSFNIGILTENKSVIDAVLTATAWETARSTGIISEFDFEITQILTEVYSVQEILMSKTLDKIIEYLFDPDSQNIDNIDHILIQYQLRFRELTGQEITLEKLYNKAIKKIKK